MRDELNLEELRAVQLDLLREFQNICQKLGLKYFLANGSLWGAVRYQGYLPWDDDIDILMPRPDYLRLVAAFDFDHTSNQGIGKLSSYKKYRLRSFSSDKDYYYPFAKLERSDSTLIEDGLLPIENLGINIDIFPLNGLPEKGWKFHIHKLRFLNAIRWRAACSSEKKTGRALRPVRKAVCRICMRHIEKLSNQWDFSTATCFQLGLKNRITAKVFASHQTILFEGLEVPAPADPGMYLRLMYGDYMREIPECDQTTGHIIRAYMH